MLISTVSRTPEDESGTSIQWPVPQMPSLVIGASRSKRGGPDGARASQPCAKDKRSIAMRQQGWNWNCCSPRRRSSLETAVMRVDAWQARSICEGVGM
ncbi:hypothetical protein IG631_22188 [Alternaria alternata]|nr:hypothetical protein IG631_22188 [Alternaria alternata]